MIILPKLINFALVTVNRLKIDESHGLSHALKVLQYSHNIIENELASKPYLDTQREIIYTSALMHDLCDKKYMNEYEGLRTIHKFLTIETSLLSEEISIVEKIISTMSYSKVKKVGFPYLGKYEMAYHIVREADLLSAYDVDRSIIYNMNNVNPDFDISLSNALDLFENRVLRHNHDNLFITNYSKEMSQILEADARKQIESWNKLILPIEHDRKPI